MIVVVIVISNGGGGASRWSDSESLHCLFLVTVEDGINDGGVRLFGCVTTVAYNLLK